MAWLPIDQAIRDHHKILDAADALDTTPAHVTGCLVLLWLWALDNAPDGNLSGITAGTIARAAQWTEDKDQLIEVLTSVRLLDKTPEGLVIHDWMDRAGNLIDRRRADAERKRRERAVKKELEASGGTSDASPQDIRTQSRLHQDQTKQYQNTVDKTVETPPEPPQADGEEAASLQDQRFDQFWQAYPKKVGKADARKAWKRAKVTSEIFERILTAIEAAKASEQWQRENGRYIPNPATWINQGRWDDEIPAASPFTAPQGARQAPAKESTLSVLRRIYAESAGEDQPDG